MQTKETLSRLKLLQADKNIDGKGERLEKTLGAIE